MNSIRITDLPDLLCDAQRADACAQRYPQKEYVFIVDKWRDLVNTAYKFGKLPFIQGTIETSGVNRWLADADLSLWSSFQLHEPIFPDLEGKFEKQFSDLEQALQERIGKAEPTLTITWDRLSPDERLVSISDADSVNSPRTRLFFAIGDIVLWGGHLNPPEQTLIEAAKKESLTWESLQANSPAEKQLQESKLAEITGVIQHLEAIRDKLLFGQISEADAISEMIGILEENADAVWCRSVPVPIWVCAQKTELTPTHLNVSSIIKRKRKALVIEVRSIWPNIENDLNNAGRNKLSARAKLPEHGYWNLAEAVAWALVEGQITKDKASSAIAQDSSSELSVLLKQIIR